jgi:hypothetical protein
LASRLIMSFRLPPGSVEQSYALPGVPEDFINIIGDVEQGKLPYTWALEKNEDGFSLTLKTPAQVPMRTRRHFERRVVNKDTSSWRQDRMKSSSCSVPDKVPIYATPRKHKSPSCKQRDRNRRRRWKRKKKSPQPLDTSASDSDNDRVLDIFQASHFLGRNLCLSFDNANPSVIRDTFSADSAHDKVQDSLPIENTDPSVVQDTFPTDYVHDTVQDSFSQASRLAGTDQSGFSPGPANANLIVELDDSESEEGVTPPSPSYDGVDDPLRRCFLCECLETETAPLIVCEFCKSAAYCSNECRMKHWHGSPGRTGIFPHKRMCRRLRRSREDTPADPDIDVY